MNEKMSNTAHFDFNVLDKKQVKLVLSFLTKMKRIYKDGFYIINTKYLYPDDLSIQELLGEYVITLNDKISNLLKLLGIPQTVFIKDSSDYTTKATEIVAEIPEDREETEWLKGYYKYASAMDNMKKKGLELKSGEELISFNRDEWINKYLDLRQTLIYDKDDIKFYHSSKMFPFLSIKNFDNLYFSACNRDDNYTGELYFLHEIDEFKIEAHFYFLRL